jgi:hypothetical protein
MQGAWLDVLHVTQWEDADITELENFRETRKSDTETGGDAGHFFATLNQLLRDIRRLVL